jgi:outer membrane protein W
MKSYTTVLSCAGLLLCSALLTTAKADASSGYHFEAGLSYATGTDDVLRQVETNFGFSQDYKRQVGLHLAAYNRFSENLAIGGSVGPCMFFKVTDSETHYTDKHDQWNYVIPVSADVRFFFDTLGVFVPYLRAGLAYSIAGGDYIGSGSPGLVAAVGTYIGEKHGFKLGLELGYDSSTVKVKSGYLHQAANVRPTQYCFRVFAAF